MVDDGFVVGWIDGMVVLDHHWYKRRHSWIAGILSNWFLKMYTFVAILIPQMILVMAMVVVVRWYNFHSNNTIAIDALCLVHTYVPSHCMLPYDFAPVNIVFRNTHGITTKTTKCS